MLLRDKKDLTPGSQLLLFLMDVAYIGGRVNSLTHTSGLVYPEYSAYTASRRFNSLLSKYKRKGWLRYEYKEGKRIVKLTKHGELKALVVKMEIQSSPKTWDGKWRLVIIDIPESARDIRHQLRGLLKLVGFKALQASVYINPYPLSQDSVDYLNRTKLARYIRMLRVDKVDSPKDLLKAFKLKHRK